MSGVPSDVTWGTTQSVGWDGNKLVITSEKWIERERGTRESVDQHTEVWWLRAPGQLVITVTDKKENGEASTRELTYRNEQPSYR